jgi:hypothetical protein
VLVFAREVCETAWQKKKILEMTNDRIAYGVAVVNDGATAKLVVGPMNGQIKTEPFESKAALWRPSIMRTL